MKIAALCPTYNRPRLLGQMIKMFELQDYPNRELIVLDDANQYGNREGDRWRIISVAERYRSVEAKRNAMAQLTDADFLAVWDDDDIYLPWALSACVHALAHRAWVRPSQVLEWEGPGKWKRCRSHTLGREDFCYGGCWAYRREWFLSTGGYPEAHGNGGDWKWATTQAKLVPSGDTICAEYPDPYYCYSRDQSGSWHASELGQGESGYESLINTPREDPGELQIELLEDYPSITIPAELHPRVF